MRRDREDLTAQRERMTQATHDLCAALSALTVSCQYANRALRGLRPTLDLTEVHADHRRVCRAEEAYDLAALDLRTAAGEDA